jgi:hypothetical protein
MFTGQSYYTIPYLNDDSKLIFNDPVCKYKSFDGTVVYLAAFHTNMSHKPRRSSHMQYFVFDY